MLFTILSVPVFGNPEEGNEDPTLKLDSIVEVNQRAFKNQIYLDIHMLGLGLGYSKKVHKNLSIGIEAGGGLMYQLWIKNPSNSKGHPPFPEIYYYNLLASYSFSNIFQLVVGLGQTLYALNVDNVEKTNSVKLRFLTDTKKIQFGISFTIGTKRDNVFLSYLSFPLLRINLNKQ